MKKLLLCLTAVICFSLLNVATADSITECRRLLDAKGPTKAFPFCLEACNLNYGDACEMVGVHYYVREDYQLSETYLEKACNLNYALGCVHLGNIYIKGKNVIQDYHLARTYLEKACNLNYALGCFALGTLYDTGRGVIQNFQTAKEYYGKACDLGEQAGCTYKELNEKGY